MDKLLVISILIIYIAKENVICVENCPHVCQNYYERESLVPCSKDVSDCGTCIEGTVMDLDNDDVCVELTISADKSSSALFNTPLVIPCVFSVRVRCKWELNGQTVDTGSHSRIQLLEHTQSYSTQCNLRISHVTFEDAGNWTCSNVPLAIKNNSEHRLSATTRLQVLRPQDGRSDDRTQPEPSQPFPYQLVLIAVSVLVLVLIVAVIVYVKVRAKRRSKRRMDTSNGVSLLAADRLNSPLKLNFSITINTPLKAEIVAV